MTPDSAKPADSAKLLKDAHESIVEIQRLISLCGDTDRVNTMHLLSALKVCETMRDRLAARVEGE